MKFDFDFLVLGGGSAGFNAARVAADLGLKTAVVDGARHLGGLCILRGCMPSKTLLYVAEVLHLAQKAKVFGLRIPSATPDMKAIHARKKKIIADFASYRAQALESGQFELIRANGSFVDPHTIELSDDRQLRAKHMLIATGSKVSVPNVPGLADTPFWSSDEVLDLDFVPESVLVLGGGIVACELAQFLRRIGSRVILVQRSLNILRDHSAAASAVVEQALRDDGIELFTGTHLQRVWSDSRGVNVEFLCNGKVRRRRAAHLFNALGRQANTTSLNLRAAGIRPRITGQIPTNRWQQTRVPHIYAAGDCAGPVEIVHVAIQQGDLAARHAAGIRKLKPVDYSLLLNVVFTDPQLATIGRLERDLERHGRKFLVASYPFNDHGKSILMEANYGYVKVIAEPRRGRILGAEIVGKDAGELIHAFSAPLAMRATVFDLLRAPWYHPTLAEIITYPLEEIAEQVKR
ncbi:dihydrolipoyl dehydrogenase family protein [Opitutus terrae]|uniref:Pyridine nucleotide-disulphide oxidoreductase dimerisation region n=1 Tax=Opitutus terrae (strain DSM 11246 / JCM 15787 / PB90-1) TaxID=452637 RepID=B1ZW13_OPITP|nr:NAD(P)/FAD-dependent oxidoreductase [Opitutus terrae]ACB76027.1 pyridine nucleotide-disulphide oxidoreductase dimerisation region [Opitutus terrae PB90-1]